MKKAEIDWLGDFEVYTITEQITDHLMHTIVFEAVDEGEKLPSEAELADLFGVSRKTVREALKSLSDMKLLESKTGRNGGHYVAKITQSHVFKSVQSSIPNFSLKDVTFNNIYEMRLLIDVKAAYLAALNRSKEDLERIKYHLYTIKTKEMADHLFFRSDYEVHRSIGKASKNKLIVISLDLLSRTLAPMFQYIPCPADLKELLIFELEQIYIAIRYKDPDRAVEAMSKHIYHFNHFFQERDAQANNR